MRIVASVARIYVGLLLLALGWIYLRNDLRWTLFIRLTQGRLWLDLLIGIGCATFVIGLSLFASRNFLWAQLLEEEFTKVLVPLQLGGIALVALLSGTVEETLFRGAIQPALGLIPTSLLFGLAHLVPRKALLPWSVYAAFAGFLLGSAVELTQDLFPAILAHCVANFVLILMLNRRRRVQPA